ncbi:glycosyltransferase [Clostridioides difficile]
MDNEKLKIDKDAVDFIKNWNIVQVNGEIKFTSIIILTYNQLKYTKVCIESIRKFTDKTSYEIIIVDNNSTDGTVEWLESQNDLIVIYNKENMGFPKGCNQGIEIAKGDNILLLNNDTIVTPNWLYNMNKALWSHESIGAVGVVSNNCSYHQQIDVKYTNLDEMLTFGYLYNRIDENLWSYRNKLVGYCMMIKKDVLDQVGLLDEIFTPGNFEDDDISCRIFLKGYKLILCKDTFIHHFGSVSFKEKRDLYNNLLCINSEKFKNKWNFNAYVSNNICYELISKIDEEKSKKLNILEIGCGLGATLIEIKNIYKNACTYGLENNKHIVDLSKNIFNIKYMNVENIKLQYDREFFDYIIINSKILDNLNDLDKYLMISKEYLKKRGHIILDLSKIINSNQEIFNDSNQNADDINNKIKFYINEIKEVFTYNKYDIEEVEVYLKEFSESDYKIINYIYDRKKISLNDTNQMCTLTIKANKIDKYKSIEFTNLKYILMRIDNDIDVEKHIDYIFENYAVDEELMKDIIHAIDFNIINKLKLFNLIGIKAFDIRKYEFSLGMFMEALKINRNDIDIVYNLCYILCETKEYDIAYNIIIGSDAQVRADEGISDISKLLKENYNE